MHAHKTKKMYIITFLINWLNMAYDLKYIKEISKID